MNKKTNQRHHLHILILIVLLSSFTSSQTSSDKQVNSPNQDPRKNAFINLQNSNILKDDAPCKPPIENCLQCDKDNACTTCDANLFLDINSKPFKCVPCPTSCMGCD